MNNCPLSIFFPLKTHRCSCFLPESFTKMLCFPHLIHLQISEFLWNQNSHTVDGRNPAPPWDLKRPYEKLGYSSSHNHGSMENGCISHFSVSLFLGNFPLNHNYGRKVVVSLNQLLQNVFHQQYPQHPCDERYIYLITNLPIYHKKSTIHGSVNIQSSHGMVGRNSCQFPSLIKVGTPGISKD